MSTQDRVLEQEFGLSRLLRFEEGNFNREPGGSLANEVLQEYNADDEDDLC